MSRLAEVSTWPEGRLILKSPRKTAGRAGRGVRSTGMRNGLLTKTVTASSSPSSVALCPHGHPAWPNPLRLGRCACDFPRSRIDADPRRSLRQTEHNAVTWLDRLPKSNRKPACRTGSNELPQYRLQRQRSRALPHSDPKTCFIAQILRPVGQHPHRDGILARTLPLAWRPSERAARCTDRGPLRRTLAQTKAKPPFRRSAIQGHDLES